MRDIYLDFDAPPPKHLIPFVTECCRRWGWGLHWMRYDRTRRGWHVIVRTGRQLNPWQVVAAQAIWGSDRRREMHNLGRVQNLHRVPRFWRTRWNVLYAVHERGVRWRRSA